MKQFDENAYDYKQTIEEASQLIKRQCTSFEEKLDLFESLYMLLSECFPIELKKLRLYSVNRLNGVIDKEYLRKYKEKEYVDLNIAVLSSFVEGKKIALGSDFCNDHFYVKSIKIRHFRSIIDMTLHFQKGINVLIGDNGTGKTSILDAIAISLREAIGAFNVTKKRIDVKDISVETDYTTIECIVNGGEEDYYSFQGINHFRQRVLYPVDPIEQKPRTKKLAGYLSNRYLYPVISYHCISVGKQVAPYRSKKYDSMQGYTGCLNGRADIQLVTEWLEKTQSSEQKKYIRIINEFISMIESDRSIEVKYVKNDLFVKTEPNDMIPLSYMSSGFQTILNLVMDIAYRLTVLNPSIVEPSKMFGIVLIDEVELHLHPKWQWTVLSCLEKMFPNIQFIVSTHSPMIVSSCEKCNLLRLIRNSNGEVEYSKPSTKGLYGKSIEDVLVYNMDSGRIPSDLKAEYEQFQHYYNIGDYESAGNILKDMKKKFGKDNGTVRDADFMLNLTFDDENGV